MSLKQLRREARKRRRMMSRALCCSDYINHQTM